MKIYKHKPTSWEYIKIGIHLVPLASVEGAKLPASLAEFGECKDWEISDTDEDLKYYRAAFESNAKKVWTDDDMEMAFKEGFSYKHSYIQFRDYFKNWLKIIRK